MMDNLQTEVQISDKMSDVLKRLNELEDVYEAQNETLELIDEKYNVEYRKLHDLAVPYFIPIIERLCRAGLISVVFNLKKDDLKGLPTCLEGYPSDIDENGSIVLIVNKIHAWAGFLEPYTP